MTTSVIIASFPGNIPLVREIIMTTSVIIASFSGNIPLVLGYFLRLVNDEKGQFLTPCIQLVEFHSN